MAATIRVDSKYPPYYVYEHDKLYKIDERWIERDYNVAYPIRAEMWSRFCRDGVHSAFNAMLLLKAWKLSAMPVVVLRVLASGGEDRFLWCMRVNIHSTAGPPFKSIGRCFLWPLSPMDAFGLWKHLANSPSESGSRLVTDFCPWFQIDGERPFCSWLDLSGTTELDRVPGLEIPDGEHMVLAAVRPTVYGSTQPNEVARFMQPREDLKPTKPLHLSTACVLKRLRSDGTCPFNLLTADAVDSVLDPLVLAYVYTPAHEALARWTALRQVSQAFRSAVDAATAAWVDRAVALLNRANRERTVEAALRLRDFVVPTGLNVVQLLAEVYHRGSASGPHWRLLVYMRLRARKPLGAQPPPAPVRPLTEEEKRLVDIGPRMGRTHGKLFEQDGWATHRHNTRRASEEVSLRVRMVGRVPHHLVNYAKICLGWEVVESSR
tara:strand:+ start:2008 stop:3312 length:1305 start_codon:yes stop_codon:yes gene_type:complete